MSRLAQLVERKTLNLVVVGSSPTVGVSGAHGAMAARRIPDPKVGGSNPSGLKVCFSFCFLFFGPGKYTLARVCTSGLAWL